MQSVSDRRSPSGRVEKLIGPAGRVVKRRLRFPSWDDLSRVTISRAGAVAAVVAQSRLQRALPTTMRAALLVGGAAVIGIGAVMTLSTGLGPGPFDVLITAIAGTTGLPVSVSLWLITAVLLAVVLALGRRPGPGTVVAPLIIGAVIDAGLATVTPLQTSGSSTAMELGGAIALHLIGVAIIGVGSGAMVASSLGAGVGDLLSSATSARLHDRRRLGSEPGSTRPGPSTSSVRTVFELCWLGVGLALGGQAGLGTVLVALSIGPAVRNGHRLIVRWVDRARTAGDQLLAGPTGRSTMGTPHR